MGFLEHHMRNFRLCGSFGPESSLQFSVSDDRDGGDVAYSNEVESGCREGEHPADSFSTSMPCLPKVRHRFHPTEDFLNPLALSLTYRVTAVSGRTPVYSASTARAQPLRDMRRDRQVTKLGNESTSVVPLVRAQCDLPGRQLCDHHDRRLALRHTIGMRQARVDNQPVSILHQG